MLIIPFLSMHYNNHRKETKQYFFGGEEYIIPLYLFNQR